VYAVLALPCELECGCGYGLIELDEARQDTHAERKSCEGEHGRQMR
jgi:hypothetical protein